MRVYLAAPIRGPRTEPAVYEAMAEAIRASGHQVLSEHPVGREPGFGEAHLADGQIFIRDVEWLNQADVLVAEVSTPSLGVGWEVAYMLARGRLVVCVCAEEARRGLSAMISGNPSPWQRLLFYKSPADLRERLAHELRLK